jgi:hypothetical protein
MNKVMKVVLLLAVVAVGLFGAYRYGMAQEAESTLGRIASSPPTFNVELSPEPLALATNHTLQRNYYNNGNYGAAVPADVFTPIDTQLTVQCPGTSGTCTFQADMWIESGYGTHAENIHAICLYVDGNPASTDCSYASGQTPSDGSFTKTSTSQSVSGIAPGNHTVQTYFNPTYGVTVARFASNYRVYKP